MVERGMLKRDEPRLGRKAGIHLTAKGGKTLPGRWRSPMYKAQLTGH